MAKNRDRDRLSAPVQARQERRVETRIEAILSTGPIPSPEVLAQYQALDPGLLDRIVRMAESEQTHRHDVERTSSKALATWLRRGQVCGGALGVGTLAIAAYAVSQGQPWVAGTAITSITAILGAFVWRERADARADKPGDD